MCSSGVALAAQVLGIMTDLTIQQPVQKTYYGSKIMAKSSARNRILPCKRSAAHVASLLASDRGHPNLDAQHLADVYVSLRSHALHTVVLRAARAACMLSRVVCIRPVSRACALDQYAEELNRLTYPRRLQGGEGRHVAGPPRGAPHAPLA